MAWTAITRPPTPSDTTLQNHSGWSQVYSNPGLGQDGAIVINYLTRRLEGQASAAVYRYNASSSPSGDQAIRADIRLPALSVEESFGLMARVGASGGGYGAFWQPLVNTLSLYRWIGGTSYSFLTSITTTFDQGSVLTQAFLKVIGTGSGCTIVAGDATRGSLVTYYDNASPQTNGKPGIRWNAANGTFGSANPAWLTNLVIENWSSGAGSVVHTDGFNLGGWTAIARPS